MITISTHIGHAIAEAVYKLEFYADALLDIRAQRREIIEMDAISETRRKYLLEINSDVTTAVRKQLSEIQHTHAELIQKSADRIADSVPVTFSTEYPVLPANDALFDVYEGQGDMQ